MWKIKINKNMILSLCLGQLLSLFIAGTAISSAYLSKRKVNCPGFQSFTNYLLLAMSCGIYVVYTTAGSMGKFLRQRGWMYVIAAVIDVEANFVIVMAYQYTSVTSVQLLDCMTIPTAIAASIVVFKIRYLWSHYLGACLCITGSIAMVLVDTFMNQRNWTGSKPVLGDCLVIGGAVLYGLSNVFQDYLVRRHGPVEYLGGVGLVGTLVSGTQSILLERSHIAAAVLQNHTDPVFWTAMAVFTLSMLLLYCLMPHVMRISSCVLVNLSLLTADVYALIMGIFLFGNLFHGAYFAAYLLIMLGAGLYVSRNPVSAVATTTEPLVADSGDVPQAIPTEKQPISCDLDSLSKNRDLNRLGMSLDPI